MPILSAYGRPPFLGPVAVVAGLLAGASFVSQAGAGNSEPPQCLSPDPSQWPAPAKPYFMLAVDTSSSMAEPLPFQLCSVNTDCTAAAAGTTCQCLVGGAPPCGVNGGECNGVAPSCAGYPSNRSGHERCALQNTIEAFGGQVNLGIAGFPLNQTGCAAALTCSVAGGFSCYNDCSYTAAPGDPVQTAPGFGCGPEPGGIPANRQGGNILVPMLWDHFWQTAPPTCTLPTQCPSGICTAGACTPTNVPNLLQYVDNSGVNSEEVWATGKAPINGMLADMYRYFAGTYVNPVTGTAVPTPLDPTNERACRSVNVILISAGDENCDSYADATAAATNLYTGVTVGSFTWSIRTHVIAFVGGKNAAVLAGLGASSSQTGTTAGHGYFANPTNAVALSQALAAIIGSAIQPETCDNVDNNCNGCTDEGFNHYCDLGQTCCNLPRATCLANYQASITTANPQGDVTQLPCTDANAGSTPATWLCYNPGDVCDNADNNCNGQVDEGATKCGSPLHCPQAETCNGQDDNCNGVVDEGPSGVPYSICPNMCQPAPEICDGCDNDCDGQVDDNVPNAACGLPANPPQTPAYCTGVLKCTPQGAVPPGTCVAGGGKTTCVFPAPGPQPEVCNGIDDNCNGIVDDGIPSTPCVPAGSPPGLVYGGTSQCKMGQTQCINGATVCVGWVGPSAEVCDGLDNDCDGVVDDGTLPGTGQPCGTNQGTCKPGKTACVNGALACQGGVGPTPEICDGLDNDCNGMIDDGMLGDAPAPGMAGCWDLPGNCCSYVDPKTSKITSWCPPPGATCTGLGSLVSPCAAGMLVCGGAPGWVCQNAKDPSAEVCNGIDDNCNGIIDDGVLPAPVGNACGTNVGECKPGVYVCVNGMVVCNGNGPTPEVCDGKDNDCDGVVDDNIPGTGVPCQVAYDTTAYPGARNHLPCKPGVTQCDSTLGMLVCKGGVGPSPEVCDGLDNDCDGMIDEMGAPPDGITGTADPGMPSEVIGQACGDSVGVCKPGVWACGNGMFVCSGGVLPQPETCDCKDNDCDGTVDNQNPGNMPPLCSSGKSCVKSAAGCGCAAPCGSGEFPCPGGQTCVPGTVEGTDGGMGSFCVANPCPDCLTATVKAGGTVVCAPVGTPADPTTCQAPPVCACHGQTGCQAPCFGVTCPAGAVCAPTGANAGTSVADTCFNVPCSGCGKVCNGGVCQDDPCTATSCPTGEECKPSPDFTTFTCVKPCATVSCSSSQACVDGTCAATCAPACAAGQTCDMTQTPPACVADKCAQSPCTGTSCCDPLTGACGNCPCEGILCPTGATCQAGQCVSQSGAVSSSSASSSSSSGGNGGSGGATGVFGLATGGGGWLCSLAPDSARFADGRWALLALALAMGRRRRRDRKGEEVAR